MQDAESEIHWPAEFDPASTPVHVRNEMEMNAPPERVWAWLVRAPRWPEWYPNSKRVCLASEASELKRGTVFRWKTFGASLTSEVLEYIPGERLAWNARGLGVQAYHAWLLQPRNGGCRVLTEETQRGWLCRLGHLVVPNRMFKGHQIWLERLRCKALVGPPES